MKKIHIFAGGTVAYVAPHLALSAPAYGKVGHFLNSLCRSLLPKMETTLHLTRMAGGNRDLETNDDLAREIRTVVQDLDTKVVIMAAAVVDFGPGSLAYGGKEGKRFSTRGKDVPSELSILPTRKILPEIRKTRKDIFAVGFSTTADATAQEMFAKAIQVLKGSSVNLVLANDIRNHLNMIVTPEESYFHLSTDRELVLKELVEMIGLRSNLTFTQSRVVEGTPVSWADPRVPSSLRTVVDHCIKEGAYKPINGKTAGHFAVKLKDDLFLTSIRKTDFNDLAKIGLVLVKTDGPDTVMAYGAKPSVGGQSQRIVFRDHPGFDCIVHMHSPLRKGVVFPTASQREFECGSHECGANTSKNLVSVDDDLKCVMLDNHGPNIVFKSTTNPEKVIKFIDRHFDLKAKTGLAWDGNGV